MAMYYKFNPLKSLVFLRKIIISETQIDPKQKTRKREVIDNKKIFSHIAINHIKGTSFSNVGKFLGVDHATVLHHNKSAKSLIEIDKIFKKKYNTIFEVFNSSFDNLELKDLKHEINKTELRLEKLKKKYSKKLLANCE